MKKAPTRTTNIRIGTRASSLALAQTEEVRQHILAKFPDLTEDSIEVIKITTIGDRIQDRPLSEIGGKSLFTKEIEEALLENKIDIAVHSLKDMPAFLPDGLAIGAVLKREDPRDALICPRYNSIMELPVNSTLGTSSIRRASQVLALRPDIKIVPLRGNVNTRLDKLKTGQGFDSTILAVAGLKRLNISTNEYQPIEKSMMLPAVAQGAICIECRSDDAGILELLAEIDHKESNICTAAERAVLGVLEGSCKTPIAALAEIIGGELHLNSLSSEPDGSAIYRASRISSIKDAVNIGKEAGFELKTKAKHIFG